MQILIVHACATVRQLGINRFGVPLTFYAAQSFSASGLIAHDGVRAFHGRVVFRALEG